MAMGSANMSACSAFGCFEMSAVPLGAAVAVAAALAYELKFTQATLVLGRELFGGGGPSGTGYQDAITPPRSTVIAMCVYALSLIVLVWAFVSFGFLKGAGLALGFIVGVGFIQALLPAPTSPHYRNLIIGSMCRRYADFVRDGDRMRADAMADLLQKAGIQVEDRFGSSGRGA